MKFRTELMLEPNKGFISYRSDILALGSCFSDEIGNRLKKLGFGIDTNPGGILFNPHSLARLLSNALNEQWDAGMIVSRDDLFFHLEFHSRIFGNSPQLLEQQIKQVQSSVKSKLLQGDLLFITFGTAWVYRYLESDNIVANCHKLPQKEFSKELLNLDDLKQKYFGLFSDLFTRNKALRVVLTVSPVRHVKDGLHENNLSKSVLLLLCDYLRDKFPEQVIYFPAYELVLDDLRDYRFFREDLIHPTKQAVDYVFEKFSEAYFDSETSEVVKVKHQINLLEDHTGIITEKGQQEKLNELKASFTARVNKLTNSASS